MKDSLNDLFHQRFQGHEAAVDPTMWQVIEARLLTTPPAADPVNELLRTRFSGHEVNVPPGVWQGIGSQLGHGAGFGSFGWIAAGIGGVVLTGGLIYMLSGAPDEVAVAQLPQQQEVMVAEQDPALQVGPEGNAAIVIAASDGPAVAERSPLAIAPPVVAEDESAVPVEPEVNIPALGDPGLMDTSGAPRVREIIAAIEDAAARDLQVSQHTAITIPNDPGAQPEDLMNQQGDGSDAVGERITDEVKEPCTLYLENIFTPNNDNINDVYEVNPPPCITSARIRIFSISGQLVFTMNNYEPWVGANCEEGWYLVAGEASTLEGAMIPVKGTVFLKRSNN